MLDTSTEAQTVYEPGDERITRAQAGLDTLVALCGRNWPHVDGPTPDPVDVSLAQIAYDRNIQVRVLGTDPGRVEEFVAQMQAGDRFPPLAVFWDQEAEALWLGDGFHRYEAAQRLLDCVTFPCLIYAGSRRDAEEYAATCNARHGLPMSREDKHAAVLRLLDLHPDWPDREIARRVGCSPTTVGSARREMTNADVASVQIGQIPTQRTVQRGDQTYTYTPPDRQGEPSQQGEPLQIEPGDGEELEHSRASQRPKPEPEDQAPPTNEAHSDLDEWDRQVRLRGILVEGGHAALRDFLAGHRDTATGDLAEAINTVFATYPARNRIDVAQCLIAAILGPGADGETACPRCGCGMLTIRNGSTTRRVCRECGAETMEEGGL